MHADFRIIDQLVAELAQLKARVADLEKVAYNEASGYVEGWTNAARLLGISEKTCKRRYAAGIFPLPCKIETMSRLAGPDHQKMTWPRCQLVAYAEGK